MNKKYLYPKECFLKGNNELMLKNQKVLNQYITEKIKLLITSVNFSSILLQLYWLSISEEIFNLKGCD